MTRSTTYRHFGLVVDSEWPLPLESTNIDADRVDVRVRRGHVPIAGRLAWESQTGLLSAYYECDPYRILDMGYARFAITPHDVIMEASDESISTHQLLFPVWAAVLTLHGREPLHGAVVERNGRGLALFGRAGDGKTTSSLMLIDQGWRLVTDDLIAFDEDGRVLPGPPFMRLRPDRAAGRLAEPDGAGKSRFLPPVSQTPVRLSGAIILTSDVSELRLLSSTEAVQGLLTTPYNVFPTRPAQALNWLRAALDLARRIPIYGAPPRSLTADQLRTVAES